MNIDSARHARDIVLTWYICDDQYTGDRIEAHLEECKYDWNLEEIDKPLNERIPLPKPTSDFSKLLIIAKQLVTKGSVVSDQESAEEQHGEGDNNIDEEDERNEELKVDEPHGSAFNNSNKSKRIPTESESNIENSLVSCPNWNRTFFPERLNVHLKSCKPGNPMKKTTEK